MSKTFKWQVILEGKVLKEFTDSFDAAFFADKKQSEGLRVSGITNDPDNRHTWFTYKEELL